MDFKKLENMIQDFKATITNESDLYHVQKIVNNMFHEIKNRDNYTDIIDKFRKLNYDGDFAYIVPALDGFIEDFENELYNMLENGDDSGTIEGMHAKIESQNYELITLKMENEEMRERIKELENLVKKINRSVEDAPDDDPCGCGCFGTYDNAPDEPTPDAPDDDAPDWY